MEWLDVSFEEEIVTTTQHDPKRTVDMIETMSETEGSELSTDGWALIDTGEDLPTTTDDDTYSSTSSVEVMDDDDEDAGADNLDNAGTPLVGSHPKQGPFYILRLPSIQGEVHGNQHVGTRPSHLSQEQETKACPNSGLTESELMNASFNDADPVVTSQRPPVHHQISREDIEDLCKTLEDLKNRVQASKEGACSQSDITQTHTGAIQSFSESENHAADGKGDDSMFTSPDSQFSFLRSELAEEKDVAPVNDDRDTSAMIGPDREGSLEEEGISDNERAGLQAPIDLAPVDEKVCGIKWHFLLFVVCAVLVVVLGMLLTQRIKMDKLVMETNTKSREVQLLEDQLDTVTKANLRMLRRTRDLESQLGELRQEDNAGAGDGNKWRSCVDYLKQKYRGKSAKLNITWQEFRTEMKVLADELLHGDVYNYFYQYWAHFNPSSSSSQSSSSYSSSRYSDSTSSFSSSFSSSPPPPSGKSYDSSDSSYKSKSEGSSDSNEEQTGGFWTYTVLKMMNKTRGHLKETLEQVKNVSDSLWSDPIVSRLHQAFSSKLERLSNKFHDKLSSKFSRWFGRWGNVPPGPEHPHNAEKQENDYHKGKQEPSDSAKKQEPSHNAEKQEPSQARTFRRKFEKEEETTQDPVKQLVDLSVRVDALNKWRFERLVRSRNFQPLMAIADTLSAINVDSLSGVESIQDFHSCQYAWWNRALKDLNVLSKGAVDVRVDPSDPSCFPSLCCWQVKVIGGDVKHCRRLKRKLGALEDSCLLDPDNLSGSYLKMSHHEADGRKNKHQKHSAHNVDWKAGHKLKDNDDIDDGEDFGDDVTVKYIYDDEDCNKNGDKKSGCSNANSQYSSNNDFDVDYDDQSEEINTDNDDANWYIERAEGRKYLHDEPDDWFFRRSREKHSVYNRQSHDQSPRSDKKEEVNEDNDDDFRLNSNRRYHCTEL
ncbi:uncharacterized protein LOC127878206 isoform X2 [Dreissena polymorpha]|nr:uncharacterized protein LOC127878206 isoform X2 [Dreissena polymorpha]